MQHKILRAWDSGKNKVRYVYHDPESGRTNLGEEKTDWFFYVKTKDFNNNKPFFKFLEEQYYVIRYEHEHTYTRVYVDREHNSELLDKNMEFVWEYKDKQLNYILGKLLERNIQHYEADLKVYQRWIITNNVEFESEHKLVFLDIETDDSKMTGQPIPGEFQILSCAFCDSEGKAVCLVAKDMTDEAEEELLVEMAKVINHYDVLVAFNGLNFDFPYIKARFEKYGIQIDWRKKFLQDHMVIYKKLGPALPSYSLDSISKFVLGEGKVEHEEGITEMFLNNPKLFKEYNTQDVMLMYKIEQKTNFLSVAREVNTIGRCPCDDVYISRKIDMMVLIQAYEDGHFHFKTKEYQEKVDDDDEQFIGAFVKTPSPGLYENVQVFDFSSLYPNTIKTFNISPDTLVTDENKNDIPDGKIISCPSGHKFRKDFIGIIPKVIASTADKRNYYKNLLKTVQPGTVEHKTYDRLQYVFKYFGLSFYGVIGMKTSRFYDVRVAESVTLGGQFFIKKVIEYIEAKISPVIYGDTDSCFFVFKQLEKIDLILGNISKICDHYAKKQFNSDICTLEMAYDKGFSKFLLIAKKRYAGYITYLDGHKLSDPKLYVAGLEFKRTDVCKLVKTKQEELLRALLAPENMPLAIARKFVEDLKAYLFGKNVNLVDITFGQKLTKNAEDYKAKTAHLKVVAEMKEDGEEVWVGDKIQYFIEGVDKDGKGVPKPVYKYNGVFARTYYWNKKIFPALERLLSVVYKQVDWNNYLITNKKATARGAMDLW